MTTPTPTVTKPILKQGDSKEPTSALVAGKVGGDSKVQEKAVVTGLQVGETKGTVVAPKKSVTKSKGPKKVVEAAPITEWSDEEDISDMLS